MMPPVRVLVSVISLVDAIGTSDRLRLADRLLLSPLVGGLLVLIVAVPEFPGAGKTDDVVNTTELLG